MSKYIKLEDAIHNINLEVIGRKEYTGDMKANLFFALDDLPTIEVSEDCISREHLLSKVYDMDNDNLVVDLKDIENAPSVVPKAITTVDTLLIAAALRDLAQDSERNMFDRKRAEELREQILAYGASMCQPVSEP